MKSWQILRDATEKVGVKALANRLGLSTALVYKWCQESPDEDPDASGARNPLDRMALICRVTQDERIVNWLCNVADGFFVRNPSVNPHEQEEHLLETTQKFVADFAELLSAVSHSVENDGQITSDEADRIRQVWEKLKTHAESFTVACERGQYMHKPRQR